MKKVVMGLSGGMDSATLLGYYLNKGAEVHICHFQYGSKHNEYEQESINKILSYYKATHSHQIVIHPSFDISNIFVAFNSNLLKSGGQIPEGHYNDENMKLTVVPGRNTIFASIMLGLAQTVGANVVALGVHAGDHTIYPDCREAYIFLLGTTFEKASDNLITVEAPFIKKDKTDILKIGYALSPIVPYHLTRTCYKDQEYSCAKCGSCTERLEAFNNINKNDPIKYG